MLITQLESHEPLAKVQNPSFGAATLALRECLFLPR